jgi:hypothetical protein
MFMKNIFYSRMHGYFEKVTYQAYPRIGYKDTFGYPMIPILSFPLILYFQKKLDTCKIHRKYLYDTGNNHSLLEKGL